MGSAMLAWGACQHGSGHAGMGLAMVAWSNVLAWLSPCWHGSMPLWVRRHASMASHRIKLSLKFNFPLTATQNTRKCQLRTTGMPQPHWCGQGHRLVGIGQSGACSAIEREREWSMPVFVQVPKRWLKNWSKRSSVLYHTRAAN